MRLVLVGFGVVGRGLARLLMLKERELTSVYGLTPKVVCAVDSRSYASDAKGLSLESLLKRKEDGAPLGKPKGRADTCEILRGVEADVMVETTQTDFRTGEPGFSHIKAAFRAGMSVVTVNKGPLAVAFQSITELARYNGVHLRFSGAVGGGTPVLDFGRSCSKGDTITRITGILNSTTNYILTMMERDGVSFEEALASAQREGYAETDPSLDVDGFDSAVKLVIIANHLTRSRVTLRDVAIEGIRGVKQAEVSKARAAGKSVRLLATWDGGLRVGPSLLDSTDPLCVSGPYNAVRFSCEYSGDKVVVGKGAGGMETSASVVRDLIDIRNLLGVGAS